MKRIALPTLLPATTATAFAVSPSPAVDAVDVFTGTSNSRWMLFRGWIPLLFGLVKLSPDNQTKV